MMRRNPDANPLLSRMIALRTAYQYAHWNASNYANHLLFQRLYESLEKDIDTLAEISNQRVEPVEIMLITRTTLEAAEDEIIALASAALDEGVPRAMENYLMTLLEHREQAKYLLRQQTGR
jgi:DNA-binding ferritin-like protein